MYEISTSGNDGLNNPFKYKNIKVQKIKTSKITAKQKLMRVTLKLCCRYSNRYQLFQCK